MNEATSGPRSAVRRPVVFLMGPTAAGKTALACRLHDTGGFELVSVDAAQVYRGMDIGTGKLSAEQRRRWPHHLIDIRDPAEPYSAGEFRRDALALVEAIHGRGRIPLFVGGTGFYFHALEKGLSALPAASPEVRRAIDGEARRVGWPALHARLRNLDPEAAARIDPHDAQRIQRALEIRRLGGGAAVAADAAPSLAVTAIAWVPAERAVLHARIRARLLAMLDDGLGEETRRLVGDRGLGMELPALRAVGYRQMAQFLTGEFDYETMVARTLAATRQLAKRQLTWLRHRPATVWFDAGHPSAQDAVLRYLTAKLPGGAL